MTALLAYDPSDPNFNPLNEWGSSLKVLGMGIARVAALYWHTHERAINRFQLFLELRLQTHIYPNRAKSPFIRGGKQSLLIRFRVRKQL